MGVQEGAAQRGSAWLIGSSGRTKEAVGSPIFGMGGRIVAALEVDIGDNGESDSFHLAGAVGDHLAFVQGVGRLREHCLVPG